MNPEQACAAGGERAALGIFGGTFNPIHVGHLRAAEEVMEVLELERMLFVPSADPPHKRPGDDRIAPAPRRLAWVRRAVADNERFGVDALELERPGPSYAVDTLEVMRSRLGKPPVFVIGDDAFSEIASWRDPERLIRLAHFAVIPRPGWGRPGPRRRLADCLPAAIAELVVLEPGGDAARHRDAGTWIRSVPIAALDVSGTDIRARLHRGRSVRYLVPECIYQEIVDSGVYAGGEAR